MISAPPVRPLLVDLASGPRHVVSTSVGTVFGLALCRFVRKTCSILHEPKVSLIRSAVRVLGMEVVSDLLHEVINTDSVFSQSTIIPLSQDVSQRKEHLTIVCVELIA